MMGQAAHKRSMQSPRDVNGATMGVFIYLDEVDKHFEVAEAAGAEIVHPPTDVEYGRTYWANDLEGHPWFFTTPSKAS
jgi:PhnB protein